MKQPDTYFSPDLKTTDVNRHVLAAMNRPGLRWFLALAFFTCCLLIGAACWISQVRQGIGVAGISHPVKWGVYITDFVFWVGIAHSGTLISAILLLFRARWRTSINRIAEAMTLFAVTTAGLFPLIHLGRVQVFYYLLPYPNPRQLWVNFRSPLIWDVFAVTTYITVSALFFYVGMIPDLAVVRDNSRGLRRFIYRLFSLNWKGTTGQWHHYESAYLLFAALATPLVISVHSVVSWDFAMSVVPGWHSTIFAPYFVAGAIFSGCAMVATILIPMRKLFGLEKFITRKHLSMIGLMLVFTSTIVTYSYLTEFFVAWYSHNIYEQSTFYSRAFGIYGPLFWVMLFCNAVLPLALLIKRIRTTPAILFVIAILINVGMWLERFVIIVSSLAHDFDPYAWGIYKPTLTEAGITIGSFGLFFLLFFLFAKFVPVIAISEVKHQLLREQGGACHE